MHLLDRATVIHWHRHRVAEHGLGSAGALGWRELRSQQARFEAIARAADFSHRRVLDVGCGTGDLLPFLAVRFAGLQYLGIDTVPEFIAHARQQHCMPHPRAQFELGNAFQFSQPLPHADVVVACGTLSYRSREADFTQHALRHLWAATTQALVFSVLDAAHFPPHPLLVGHDLTELHSFCLGLTPQVRLLRGEAADAATFVLYTTPAAASLPAPTLVSPLNPLTQGD
jgi:SAM-dependent methyltransferase